MDSSFLVNFGYNRTKWEVCVLLLRYFGFSVLSLGLPAVVLVPWVEGMGALQVWSLALMVPIYCCLIVFILIGFRPAQMRRALQATPSRVDDLHLWIAPILVLAGFLWAGLLLLGLLAFDEFETRHPFVYLGLLVGMVFLGVYTAIRVRKAFLQR